MIKDEQISVIVQGAVDSKYTPKCLNSIRKCLPNAEIILSTWENSDVNGLDYDVLIENKDPGSFDMSPYEKSNVKRQILSTLNGLKKATRPYALKIRSDIELVNPNFLKFYDKFNDYNSEWHFFDKRIIVPSLVSRDPRIWESPMCPSDWCSFGTIQDMLKLWDIPFPTEEEEHWFEMHQRTWQVHYCYAPLIARFNPEQFIWINFVKKFFNNLHADNMFDVNKDSIQESLLSFANNLIILSEEQYGIKFLKPARQGSDKWHVITHNEYLKLYNRYSNGHKVVSLLDFQRVELLKEFKQSYKRLFIKAKENYCLAQFIKREMKYYCPMLYYILKPLILLYKNYENKIRPEFFERTRNSKEKPYFSIVIPAHSRIKLLQQCFLSLEKQTDKDFEVILSDDSKSFKERKQIKKLLLSFHNKTGINVKYIYTKPSLGQSKNTNQGLIHVQGKWCRILHSDDYIAPDVLANEKQIIADNTAALALFHNIVPYNSLKEPEITDKDFPRYASHNADFIVKEALHTHCPVPSSLLFNSNILKQNIYFNPEYLRACDWEFWVKIVAFAKENNKTLIHIQDKKIFWRIHKNQNAKKLKTTFLNYNEYERLEAFIINSFGGHREYPLRALIYRKRRLVNDFRSLSIIQRVLLFPKFYELLKR